MARILFTWEIGEGTGHVLPALPVLRQFIARGHTVFAALRDVRACSQALRASGITVLQAPIVPNPLMQPHDPVPDTLAHVLQHHGFRSTDELRGLTQAWVALIRLIRPQQVVASYAPVSLLTAKAMGLATTLLALPFELPPQMHPLPSLRTGRPPEAGSDSPPADDAVLAVIAATVAQGGFERVVQPAGAMNCSADADRADKAAPPTTPTPATAAPLHITELHQLFSADHIHLMSIPALDLWPRGAHVSYIGEWLWGKAADPSSLTPLESSAEYAPQSTPGFTRIFVYLPADLPQLSSVRGQLKAMDCENTRVRAVIRGASTEELALWQSATIQATSTHVDFAQALETSDLLITHAGHSTVCQALLAGVPMVLIPRSLETHLTARAAVNAGAAVIANFAADGAQGILDLTASIEMAIARGTAVITQPNKKMSVSPQPKEATHRGDTLELGTLERQSAI